MNGNVAWGSNGTTGSITAEPAIGATTGVTVDGATNNAHVNIQLNAAAAGSTNTIKLGNANNYITDLTTAGTVKINVGSGGNLIDIKASTGVVAANTYLAEVTLGAHTNTSTVFNTIRVSDASGQATSYSTVITGAAKGDVLQFNNGADIVWDAVTTAEQANITGAANLATAVTVAFGTLGTAHSATSFTYGGDTYVIQNEGARGEQAKQQGDQVQWARHGRVLQVVGARRSNRASRVLKRSSARSIGTWILKTVAPSNL